MVKRMFISAAILGLCVNFLSDIEVFNQNKAAIATGESVHHSYQVLQAIDTLRIVVLESQLNQKMDEQFSGKFKKLLSLIGNSVEQQLLVNELSSFTLNEILTTKSKRTLKILTLLASQEEALMSIRVSEDEKSNARVLSRTFYANFFDIFLIFLFVGFFFYERKKALKLQGSLTKTLLDVGSSYQNLQLILAQKKSQLKTTIHDLKNPLGSIRGFAELISDEAQNKDRILKMANSIQRVSNNSLALVSALLKEDDREILPKESVRVLNCLQEACDFLRPIAQGKKQKIMIQKNVPEFSVMGYRYQLQDIFFNIIGNGLKFSPLGATVLIDCLNKNEFYEIQVKDSGPGFSPEDFVRLFEPGAKLSAQPTGHENSTGFGLYSAKQNIESLKGSIQVTNNPQAGACITIRFPVNSILLSARVQGELQ